VLVHSGETILPELDRKLGRYAAQKLEKRGVEIRLGTRVLGLSKEGVALSDGTRVPTRCLVWTAGTCPHPLLSSLGCPKQAGRLLTNDRLGVVDHPGVWAIGDCAFIPGPDGKPHPPTAQHALRQGRVLAENVAGALRGKPGRPFAFNTIGQLASIGRRAGVAQILGLRFSGFLAWWMWRTIYLSKLPRTEKKLRVLIDWTLDLLFSKDIVQYITSKSPSISHRDDAGAS
jgi:NADH dehydrogenase